MRRWAPVIAGAAGTLAGGWLAVWWLAPGIVLAVVSAAVAVLGFPLPDPAPPPGAKTLDAILDYQRRAQ